MFRPTRLLQQFGLGYKFSVTNIFEPDGTGFVKNISFLQFNHYHASKPTFQELSRPRKLPGTMAHVKEGKTLDRVERALNSWLKPQILGEGWDNIGLLVGSGKYDKEEKIIKNVMLCNDLRPAVLEEAISKNVDMIIAYHPPIFSGMKTVAYQTWKERIIARCIAHDICIYSPHTTLDSTVGGINDRVLNALRTGLNVGSPMKAIEPSKAINSDTRGITFSSTSETICKIFDSVPFQNFSDILLSVKTDNDTTSLSVFGNSSLKTVVDAVKAMELPELIQSDCEGLPRFGAGRIVDLNEPINLDDAVDMLKAHMGLGYVQLAYGGNPTIKSAAVCVGSGGSLLKPIAGKVDLLITGEMSHHDILECIAAKSSVVLCNHCSSERHYLPDLMNILKVVTGLSHIFVSDEDASPLRLVL